MKGGAGWIRRPASSTHSTRSSTERRSRSSISRVLSTTRFSWECKLPLVCLFLLPNSITSNAFHCISERQTLKAIKTLWLRIKGSNSQKIDNFYLSFRKLFYDYSQYSLPRMRCSPDEASQSSSATTSTKLLKKVPLNN